MEEMNIPLYRAKKIDRDEYVIGFYIFDGARHFLLADKGNLVQIQIDVLTLAIHFPNNLDSQGNKIFASLQEDGKGGDITLTKDGKALYERVHLCFKDGGLGGIDLDIVEMLHKKYNGVLDIKVIGIQE
jgi:hypothetical protein